MNCRLKFTTVTLWILLTRGYDAYATYQFTPDLSKESHPLVSVFGFDWSSILVFLILGSLYAIFAYYKVSFQRFSLEPQEKDYKFSDFVGYVYTGKKNSWTALLFKFPNSFKRLNFYMGHVLARCMVFAGVVSTSMWVLIKTTGRYPNTIASIMIYLTLISGCIILTYMWLSKIYKEYKEIKL